MIIVVPGQLLPRVRREGEDNENLVGGHVTC